MFTKLMIFCFDKVQILAAFLAFCSLCYLAAFPKLFAFVYMCALYALLMSPEVNSKLICITNTITEQTV